MKLMKTSKIRGGRKLFASLRGGGAMSRTSMKAVCLGAFALACSSLFAANAATLQVAISGGALRVAVPANAYDDTSKLYIVWGAADHGAEISAWPLANRRAYAGALSASAATYEISADGIPAGSVVRAIVASDVRLIDGWVSLGNGQYVNTGVKGNEAYGTEIKFRRTGANQTWASVIGSKCDNFTIGQNNNSTTSCYLRYRGVNGGLAAFSWTDSSIPHTILLKHSFADNKGHVNGAYVDGAYVTLSFLDNKNKATTGPSGALGSDAGDIFVGSSNNGSGASSGRYCYGEWHYARIFDSNGGDLRHLVAAVRGNTTAPEGVFYDKVTGKVFANAGTGTPGYDTAANVTETIPFTTACSAALPMALTAYWTGLGDLANVNDPANWACTNAAGEEVAGACPDANTIVFVRGATTFNVPAGQSLSYNELKFENCSLAANCDWSGLATVNTLAPVYALQYLDAPKNACIDTGFAPNNNTRVVFDVTVRGTLESWFGVSDDSSGNWWKTKVFGVSNDGRGVYSGFGNLGGTAGSVAANGRHTIEFDKGVFKVDSATHTTHSGQTFQLSRSLYLFADNRPNGVNTKDGTVRFHSCQIYDNGTLVRDYVPVLYGGEACLFDKVNREYARNIGSGAFAAGPSSGEKIDFYNTTLAAIDDTIDLAGHSLSLAHAAGTGTFTDTVGGGELHVDVASGETVENSTITFAGQMKLVKDGAGTFVGAKAGQTYTGGTVVSNGWAKSGAYSGAWGPAKALITVADGAGFDWAGKVDNSTTTPYSFKVAGTGPDGNGAMKTSADFGGSFYNINSIADLELDGDATLRLHQTVLNMYGFMFNNLNNHVLRLNGHILTVVVWDSFPFRNVTSAGAGTIVCVPDESKAGGFRRFSFYGAPSDLSTATLDVNDRCGLSFEADVKVLNFIDRRTLQWNDGTKDNNGFTTDKDSIDGMLTVIGNFKPFSTNLFNRVTLGDATHLSPVLDLSLLASPFGSAEGIPELAFATNATVTVDVGERAIAAGDKLVSWGVIPDCAFTLAYSGEARPIEAVARADGLYVKSTVVPAYAKLDMELDTPDWVFYDANGNVVPDWEDGVTGDIQVRFASYEEYLAVKAKNVSSAEYLLSGSFALPEGSGACDMGGGFDFAPTPGVTIDVAGRKLVLPDTMIGGTSPFTVTSSAAGGELEVTVAGGATLTNSVMTLAGSLKLVKKGAGTFVGAKAGQTYTGGTMVLNGWVKSGAYNGAWGPAKALITIADGAAFDWVGKVDASSVPYSFVIAGDGPGHTGAMISSVAVDANGWFQMNCIADMELSGDATVVMPGYMSGSMANSGAPSFMYAPGNDEQHLLILNGHTLTIRHGCRMSFRRVKTVGSGTIVNVDNGDKGSPKGISVYAGDDTTDLSSATLDVGLGGAVHAEAKFTVGTFIDRREKIIDAGNVDKMMTILDRFQPMTTNLLKTVTLGDATHLAPVLDLSGLDAPFVLPSKGCTMNLAEGATIRLRIGSRSVSTKRPVVAWSAENPPASVGSLVFTRGDEDRRYAVTVKDDGVYLNIGFTLIVR